MRTGCVRLPEISPLPRLSHDEYIQTVQDLVTAVLPSDASRDPRRRDAADRQPRDGLARHRHHGEARRASPAIDQSEQQQYSDVPISVAIALGKEMTSSAARINTVFGSCSKNGSDRRYRLSEDLRAELRPDRAPPHALHR